MWSSLRVHPRRCNRGRRARWCIRVPSSPAPLRKHRPERSARSHHLASSEDVRKDMRCPRGVARLFLFASPLVWQPLRRAQHSKQPGRSVPVRCRDRASSSNRCRSYRGIQRKHRRVQGRYPPNCCRHPKAFAQCHHRMGRTTHYASRASMEPRSASGPSSTCRQRVRSGYNV